MIDDNDLEILRKNASDSGVSREESCVTIERLPLFNVGGVHKSMISVVVCSRSVCVIRPSYMYS